MNQSDALDDAALNRLAVKLGDGLAERKLTLSLAESCTGGWIAKCLTDVAGSSAWFESGWVSYSNRAKQEELSVEAELLARHGAVSQAVVKAMAEGARRRAGSDWALAVSGVAGPGGGSADKPVGTVCFGLALDEDARAWTKYFQGEREQVRRASVAWALQCLLNHLP
ncbi:nicotinamide-nucleotide amidase [Natronospira proteinivora]|uniref:Nicotinamide-nucleotide amidase n=1 Tax=Natronospira proteinivora TaxID=1807133 RepID=A0ABT1G851_9GAMM|nr:CinA family protein [Natronospira proteinivora]MCP1727470.1 nicotinamide-nucleotide amidase [Natronospira proteinivora]